jgi:hypothetical protein
MNKAYALTTALCLLAIVLGASLALPPPSSPPANKAKAWVETWRCEVFAWSEINGTYHIRCLNGGEEHTFEVPAGSVFRRTTENVYRQFYHFQTDRYGTTAIVHITEELRLDE